MSREPLTSRVVAWLRELPAPHARPSDGSLAEAVARVSELYTRRRERLGAEVPGPTHLSARLHFFLPRDLGKVEHALGRCAALGWAPPERPRVLDLGAGVGASTLGALAFLEGRVEALEVEAWDTDASALALMQRIVAGVGALSAPPLRLSTARRSLVEEPSGGFDLILLGLVLNELGATPGQVAQRLSSLAAHLAPGGLLLVTEPALKASSRALMAARELLVSGESPHILGPCTHAAPCPLLPRQRDWCHDELRVPLEPSLVPVAERAGLRRSRLTYSWLALTPGPPERAGAGRVVSGRLLSKGKLELDICHARGLTRLRVLDRERGERSADLERAGRGDRLTLTGGAWEPGGLRLRPPLGVERRI